MEYCSCQRQTGCFNKDSQKTGLRNFPARFLPIPDIFFFHKKLDWHMTPFQNNVIGIDPKGMSDDVELKESTQTAAPILGVVSLLKFATVSVRG